MMRRVAAALVLGGTLVVLGAAQSVSTVAEQVDFRGYYADPDTGASVDDLERLATDYPDIGFVALAETPSEGADLFADRVFGQVSDRATIIVVTPDEFGASSAVYGDGQLADAFDQAAADPPGTYVDDLAQVAAALAGTPVTTPDQPATPPATSGGGGGGVFLVVVLVGLGILGFVLWRNSRKDKAALAERTAEAKAEIEAQMAVVANEILEFSDRPDTEDHPDAVAHFRKASEIFGKAEEALDQASGPAELAALSDEMAKAVWELEAAEAIVEGRDVPPPPEAHQARCFFDPTHKAATEEATIRTPAGSRTVRVCRDCAERLRRGERPQPRTVEVAGSRIPAAQAPRSYGGGGFDWLGAFSILVGGMADAAGYDWGRPRYPRRIRRSVRRSGTLPRRRTRSVASRSRPARRSVGRARRSR